MKRGKHAVLNLCTKQGNFERRISAKSHGPEYK
jgi:ribosomal protein RSM22 (predicted rRNA methylase)